MQPGEKKYYKISEVVEMLGIPAPTLRFWETQFTIISPKRNNRGVRFYSADDIDKIKMVNYLVREKGLKIASAQEQIKHNHSGVSRHHEAVDRLKAVRAELQCMLDALNRLR